MEGAHAWVFFQQQGRPIRLAQVLQHARFGPPQLLARFHVEPGGEQFTRALQRRIAIGLDFASGRRAERETGHSIVTFSPASRSRAAASRP